MLPRQQHYADSCPAIEEAIHGLTVHTGHDMLALQVKVPRMMHSELSPSSCLMSPQLAWLLSSRLPPKQVIRLYILYVAYCITGQAIAACTFAHTQVLLQHDWTRVS